MANAAWTVPIRAVLKTDMKQPCAWAAGWLLSATLLHGGAENIIKQRAKDLRDQNNARQGAAPPPRAAPAATQPPPQPAPAVPLTQSQQALGRLQSDLTALRPGAQVSETQKQQLTRSLAAIAQGKKPSPQSTSQLASSLAAALGEKLLSNPTRSRLIQNLSAVMNAEKFGASQLNDTVKDIQSIFKSNGVSEAATERVAVAARAVVSDLHQVSK